MDEVRPPEAAHRAGEDPDRDTIPHADDDQLEPDVAKNELAFQRVIDHLLGPTLARRLALAEISLQSVTPLAPVLQLRLDDTEHGQPTENRDASDAEEQGMDAPAASPDDPHVERVDGSRPRGGVVIDLARYRAGRRGFGRRGRIIDPH